MIKNFVVYGPVGPDQIIVSIASCLFATDAETIMMRRPGSYITDAEGTLLQSHGR